MGSYKTIFSRLKNPIWNMLSSKLCESKAMALLRPVNRMLVKDYRKLVQDYYAGTITEQQAREYLIQLLNVTRLSLDDRNLLEQNLLNKNAATVTGSRVVFDPLGPYAGYKVWLIAHHNHRGAPLFHNYNNYRGRPVDNREYLVEKQIQNNMPDNTPDNTPTLRR